MRRAADAILIVVLLVACGRSTPGGLEGTWRYDSERLEEFDVVANADSRPRGTMLGNFGDDSERGQILQILKREAEDTRFEITADQIVVARTSERTAMPYRVVEHTGSTYQLDVTEDGETHRVTAELDGNTLTLRTEQGGLMYALKRAD